MLLVGLSINWVDYWKLSEIDTINSQKRDSVKPLIWLTIWKEFTVVQKRCWLLLPDAKKSNWIYPPFPHNPLCLCLSLTLSVLLTSWFLLALYHSRLCSFEESGFYPLHFPSPPPLTLVSSQHLSSLAQAVNTISMNMYKQAVCNCMWGVDAASCRSTSINSNDKPQRPAYSANLRSIYPYSLGIVRCPKPDITYWKTCTNSY